MKFSVILVNLFGFVVSPLCFYCFLFMILLYQVLNLEPILYTSTLTLTYILQTLKKLLFILKVFYH